MWPAPRRIRRVARTHWVGLPDVYQKVVVREWATCPVHTVNTPETSLHLQTRLPGFQLPPPSPFRLLYPSCFTSGDQDVCRDPESLSLCFATRCSFPSSPNLYNRLVSDYTPTERPRPSGTMTKGKKDTGATWYADAAWQQGQGLEACHR